MKEFDSIIGEKLANFEATPSPLLYARIENDLAQVPSATTQTATVSRPRISRLWSYAAAAAVVTVAVVFAWRDNDQTTLTATQTVVVGNTNIAAIVPQLPTQPVHTGGRRVADIVRSQTVNLPVVEPVEHNQFGTTADDVDARLREALNSTTARARNYTNWWDEIEDESENFISRTIRGTSASLYGGNFGLLTGNTVRNSGSSTLMGGRMTTPRNPITSSTFGDRSLSNSIVEEQLIHYMPVSAGLSLSIPLTERLALTTGLNYTYLQSVSKESNIFTAGESRMVRELHYVGIPLSLTWTAWQNRYWSIYGSAGATFEKAVYGLLTETSQFGSGRAVDHERLTIDGFQPSLNASAGVMFNITRWLGLYIEPGISYYFNTGQPLNYRTENPISFSLQVGFRFNWR